MITLGLVAIILVSGLLLSTARAGDVSDCQSLITQTADHLAGATIGGRHPDQTRASLQSKLDGASTKLEEGKLQDAVDKLVNFRTAVENLAFSAKPKISQADADLLISDSDAAILCIQGLIG